MICRLGDEATDAWLDPCIGNGPFLKSLADIGVRSDRITGIDIERISSPADSYGKVQRGIDFINWSLRTESRFDKIVANPPYVSLSKVDSSLRAEALRVKAPNDSRVGGTANYWYAFLCASIGLLKPRGSLCFVLPAAWEYADYAKSLREHLPQVFAHAEVHRSKKPLFDTVQDGTVVLYASGYQEKPNKPLVRFEYESAERLIAGLVGDESPVTRPVFRTAKDALEVETTLGDFARVSLGGVTGDARYFLLTESQREKAEIPLEAVVPVLSKARHLSGPAITEVRWKRLKKANERIWLFRPDEKDARDPSVQKYIRLGEDRGVNKGYKTNARDPWYVTPLPERADAFLSGMSGVGPLICLSQTKGLTASNTLYVIHFSPGVTNNRRGEIALSFLTTKARKAIRDSARVYADGLLKHEPGDVLNLPVFSTQKRIGAEELYMKAARELLRGNSGESERLADEWFRT